MDLFFGRPDKEWLVKVVPIFVKVTQHPVPRPERCYEMGRVSRALSRDVRQR